MTTAASEAAPALGHNNPPEQTLPERLADTYSVELAKVDPLAERATKLPKDLATDEDKAAAGDIARDASDLAKALDRLRETEKKPHLQAGRQVDGYFAPAIERLDRMSKIMLDRINSFNRAAKAKADREQAEAERIERERAAKARADAEAAAKAGRHEDAMEELKDAAAAETRAAEISQAPRAEVDLKTVSAAGTAIGTRTEWKAEITDFDALDVAKLKPYFKRDEIEKALRAYTRQHKGQGSITGVRFFEDETATTRR